MRCCCVRFQHHLAIPDFFLSPDTPIPRAPPCILGIYFFFLPLNVFVSPNVCVLRSLVVCSSCCLAAIRPSLFFLRSSGREDCLNADFRVDQRYISKLHPSIHLRLEREAGCVVYRRSQENTVSLSLSFPPLLCRSRRSRSACLPFPADVCVCVV